MKSNGTVKKKKTHHPKTVISILALNYMNDKLLSSSFKLKRVHGSSSQSLPCLFYEACVLTGSSGPDKAEGVE